MSKKPVPKKQQAKSQSRSRHSKWSAEQRKKLRNRVVISTCSITGEKKLSHFASPSGYYNGQKVVATKADKKAGKADNVVEIAA